MPCLIACQLGLGDARRSRRSDSSRGFHLDHKDSPSAFFLAASPSTGCQTTLAKQVAASEPDQKLLPEVQDTGRAQPASAVTIHTSLLIATNRAQAPT